MDCRTETAKPKEYPTALPTEMDQTMVDRMEHHLETLKGHRNCLMADRRGFRKAGPTRRGTTTADRKATPTQMAGQRGYPRVDSTRTELGLGWSCRNRWLI